MSQPPNVPAIRRPSITSTSTNKNKLTRRPQKHNQARNIMMREEKQREVMAAAAAAKAASSAALTTGPSRSGGGSARCPNKACPKPNVVDGTCQTCGRVADDSNIVSEITFGETSGGAAMVQGSYLAADQGGVRIAGGPAFRRVAGSSASESRERTMREAKMMMQQFCHRLNISPTLADDAFRLYRMAAMNGFTQGRRIPHVAAICLYAACRKRKSNKVMLIDLADLCRANVFNLGKSYKAMLRKFPDVKEGYDPIIPEDLIFRFASKLEFNSDTNKIAYSAVRIAKRMQMDNMTHGRRPAGICGAAVIMAARAHSYRRTVREVVYIAKVTTHTLQLRMDEFANVPSAQLTIDEFHTNDFLEEAADPPIWYMSTDVWKEQHPTRKRKIHEVHDNEDGTPGVNSTIPQTADKRQRTADASDASQTATRDTINQQASGTNPHVPVGPVLPPSPSATPNPNAGAQQDDQQVSSVVVDKDGFVVPPLPGVAAAERAVRAEDRHALVAARGGDGALRMLASEFGDPDDVPERSTEVGIAAAQGIDVSTLIGKGNKAVSGKGKGKAKAQKAAKGGTNVAFDEEWLADEARLEAEMEGVIHNPEIMTIAAEEVEKNGDEATQKMLEVMAEEARKDEEIEAALESRRSGPNNSNPAETATPGATDNSVPGQSQSEPNTAAPIAGTPGPAGSFPESRVKTDPIVTEDEFDDDPEVMNCLLGEKEIAMKMQIWVNENEDWMRENQRREHQKKLAAKLPPKKTRNRTKVPRIGEGQASPASSAGDAAVQQLKMRAVSKKLNYQAFQDMFDHGNSNDYHRPDSIYGGTSTTANSRAPSVAPSEADSQVESTAPAVSKTTLQDTAPAGPSASAGKAVANAAESAPVADDSQDAVGDDMDVDGEEDYDKTAYDEGQDDYGEDEPNLFAEEEDWE